jgi:hypothetical protein
MVMDDHIRFRSVLNAKLAVVDNSLISSLTTHWGRASMVFINLGPYSVLITHTQQVAT